ncbi:MAG TPA: HD domain-containing phosphohydrolase [Trueperaceae bacterium]
MKTRYSDEAASRTGTRERPEREGRAQENGTCAILQDRGWGAPPLGDPFALRNDLTDRARYEIEALTLERNLEMENAQRDMVARLALAGEYRDDGTGEHPRRVGRNAAAIAHELGWPDDEVALLESAALLHDVGKIGIRDVVLLKPGKLTDREFEHMKAHTTIGARILSGGKSRLLRLAEEIALSHHERWDGEGYPLGLAGTEIPLSARIVAVADVLDALTHERPYKEAWPMATALREIKSQSGKQFDPMVVRACVRVFDTEQAAEPAKWELRSTSSDRTLPGAAALVFGMPSLKH